jgi:transcriptional regulator with XRE-family HTH domain
MAETLASLLSGARSRLGWSLRDAERAAGVPNAHLCQLETGAIKRPAVAILAKLADAYGLPVTQLAEAAGYQGITQRLVLADPPPGTIGLHYTDTQVWACAGCGAQIDSVDGGEHVISHAPGCTEMSGNG